MFYNIIIDFVKKKKTVTVFNGIINGKRNILAKFYIQTCG